MYSMLLGNIAVFAANSVTLRGITNLLRRVVPLFTRWTRKCANVLAWYCSLYCILQLAISFEVAAFAAHSTLIGNLSVFAANCVAMCKCSVAAIASREASLIFMSRLPWGAAVFAACSTLFRMSREFHNWCRSDIDLPL